MGNNNYISTLIQSSKNGRKSSFIELVNLSVNRLFAFMLYLYGDLEFSIYIIKRTYITFWNELKEFDVNYPMTLRLYEILLNESLVEYNRKNISSPNKAYYVSTLEQMVAELEFEQKIIFILHEVENFEYDELISIFTDKSIDDLKALNSDSCEKVYGGNEQYTQEIKDQFRRAFYSHFPPDEVKNKLTELIFNLPVKNDKDEKSISHKNPNVFSGAPGKKFQSPKPTIKTVKYNHENSWFD